MRAEYLGGGVPPARDYDADVIILSHRRADATIAAIRSAADQVGCNHHVIVLDQGSPAPMRAALIAAVGHFSNVVLYGVAENLGVPGGRNLATSLGRGRAIVALDNDARFTGTHVVARAAATLAATPRLGAIGFRILAADGVALDPTSWGYPKSLIAAAARRFAATTFVGCGHALSRACFDGLGGYDASLFFAWEEYEFCRRAIAGGWRIEHHGDLTVSHDVSPEARIAWRDGRWRYFVRNRLLIAHDWHGYAGILPHAAVYFGRGLRHGRAMTTMAAIIEAVRLARTRPRQTRPARLSYVHAHETIHRLPGLVRRLITADAIAPATPVPTAALPAPSGRS